jgi:hypothetical protein
MGMTTKGRAMRILCVTSVRNEAPFLLEWIAHMRAVGVTDFLIYSNDCQDGTHEMLQVLDAQGVIEHHPQQVASGTSPQWQGFRDAWKQDLRKACDWALVCDVDEFPNIHAGQGRFADLIGALPEGAQAVTLPWRLFGNSGQIQFEDTPVSASFTHAASRDSCYPIAATLFKTLFRLDGPFNQFGIHRPKQKQADRHGLPIWVDGSGHDLPQWFCARPERLSLYGLPVARDLVELNHYSLRSVESFIVKSDRGLPNRSEKGIDLAYWIERNFNTVQDRSIARMQGQMQDELDALRALPGVEALHVSAVQWHRERFAYLLGQGHIHHLLSRIILAGDSQEPSAEMAQWLVAQYQKTQ